MIDIPEYSLVILIGPSGAGKTTFGKIHFNVDEIFSLDETREEIAGHRSNRDMDDAVYSTFYDRIERRLLEGKRAVVDDININKERRFNLVDIGTRMKASIFYIVLNRSIQDKLDYSKLIHNGTTDSWIEIGEKRFQENLNDILSDDGIATVIDTRFNDN